MWMNFFQRKSRTAYKKMANLTVASSSFTLGEPTPLANFTTEAGQFSNQNRDFIIGKSVWKTSSLKCRNSKGV